MTISAIPRIRRARACDRYVPGPYHFCKVCEVRDWLHDDWRAPTMRFAKVSCSACGQVFGAGNEGYSSCDEHRGK